MSGCFNKKYPLLTENRNNAIRYHYSQMPQLNLSVFNLDAHSLHLKIIHQTPGIQARKVKIYCAPESRGFETGPSHDLHHEHFPKYLLQTLIFRVLLLKRMENSWILPRLSNLRNTVRMIKSCHIPRISENVLLLLFFDAKQITFGVEYNASAHSSKGKSLQEQLKHFKV